MNSSSTTIVCPNCSTHLKLRVESWPTPASEGNKHPDEIPQTFTISGGRWELSRSDILKAVKVIPQFDAIALWFVEIPDSDSGRVQRYPAKDIVRQSIKVKFGLTDGQVATRLSNRSGFNTDTAIRILQSLGFKVDMLG